MTAVKQCSPQPAWTGWQLEAINDSLGDASPRTIALWALAQRLPTVVSTSFGTDSAATLHLLASLAPQLPVIWVDTGFSGQSTRDFADCLTDTLSLNLQSFRPARSPIATLNALGVRDPAELDEAGLAEFTEQVKLAPFQAAIDQWQPKIWITGIRAEETALRSTLAPVTLDERGILKVAPFFAASQSDVDAYLLEHQLPRNPDYVDPTKPEPHLECGLHRPSP